MLWKICKNNFCFVPKDAQCYERYAKTISIFSQKKRNVLEDMQKQFLFSPKRCAMFWKICKNNFSDLLRSKFLGEKKSTNLEGKKSSKLFHGNISSHIKLGNEFMSVSPRNLKLKFCFTEKLKTNWKMILHPFKFRTLHIFGILNSNCRHLRSGVAIVTAATPPTP